MKVIHLISGGDVGGAKTHVHTLLSGLTKTETVRLVCFTEGPFAEEAKALGIPTTVLSGGVRSSLRSLEQMIREEGFEIVHCHGSKANLFGSLLKGRLHLPTVTTIHSDWRLDYLGRPLAAISYGSINKVALRKMDYWIGVSDVTVDMLHERGFDPNKTFVIFNGVPIPDAPPKMDRDAYLRSVGIEPEDGLTVFGIAARINPVKDMGTLVRAFSEAVKQCPKCRLIIAGDGEQRQQIEALAKELCPAGTVAFAGWISDTDSFYSALDVNMLTSLSEGFPYALPEGASHRCATVATRVGGVPSLVDDGINGLLFEPGDVKTLTEHMVLLARDPALRQTYADRIYEKTKEKFSVEATVTMQREIYETILRRTRRQAERKRDGILICGAYGKGNSGDDAILSAMVAQLRGKDPDMPIYAISRSPKQTAKEVRIGGIYTFSAGKIHRRMRKNLLYLSGGGSLIQDATSSRSLWYYLSSIRSAKRTGNKVMMFGCGIGPVRRKGNRRLAGRIISKNVDSIALRDRGSLEELEALGVTNVPTRVTADMAFLVDPAPAALLDAWLRENGLVPGENYLLIAPRPWSGTRRRVEDFAAAAVYASERCGLTPILMAMEPAKDQQLCGQIADAVTRISGKTRCLKINAPDDARLTAGLMRRVRGVLGMRLHSLIFAAAQGVPFAGVSYDPKVSSFIEYIGRGESCDLDAADRETLCAMIDRMQDAEGFREAADRLRALAEENTEICFSLLEKND